VGSDGCTSKPSTPSASRRPSAIDVAAAPQGAAGMAPRVLPDDGASKAMGKANTVAAS
jgi:hypothetical protein